MDFVMTPIFGFWYLFQAWLITNHTSFDAAVTFANTTPRWWEVIIRAILALVSMYVLATDVWVMPSPQAEDNSFKAMKRIGSWVFLTRHCLTLVCWHMVYSLLSFLSPLLFAMTHGMTIWISSLGWFVSIQYFVLVRPNPAYKETNDLWAERGVNREFASMAIHIPPCILCTLDLFLGKQHQVLNLATNFFFSWLINFVYTVFYLSGMWTNCWVVGAYPYTFMNEFKTVIDWTPFVLKQVLVMMALSVVNWAFTLAMIAIWS